MKISKRLWNVDNAKAIKARKYGWINAIHYLAPHEIAGVGNLCGNASPGCIAICLAYHSGQASMVKDASDVNNKNNVRDSRDTKTVQFMQHRGRYMIEIQKQIEQVAKFAHSENLQVCFRFDGGSDTGKGVSLARNFPEYQFGDYTKHYGRMMNWLHGRLPSNYHLTFSRSETNEDQCLEVLRMGGTVAVVFETLPETWHGFPVLNGDEHDLRHLDAPGHVVGLTPKGAARNDSTGFVVR